MSRRWCEPCTDGVCSARSRSESCGGVAVSLARRALEWRIEALAEQSRQGLEALGQAAPGARRLPSREGALAARYSEFVSLPKR